MVRRQHIEAMRKILAEELFLDSGFQIGICSRDDPHIGTNAAG
jgi:hypothetical protein